MSDINVVPYIDVMLVLLVIFMVTAPLITQGVNVNLPPGPSVPISSRPGESVVITVDQFGKFYIDAGKDKNLPVELKEIVERIRTILDYKSDTPILIRADGEVPYSQVMLAMGAAQRGGAANVGLMTVPPPRREP